MAKLNLKLQARFLGEAEPFVNAETKEISYRGYFQTAIGQEPFGVKSDVPFTGMEDGEFYEISVIQSASKFGVFYTADTAGLMAEEKQKS